HESPSLMTIPLIVLAVLSIVGGFIGVPEALGGNHWLEHYLSPIFASTAAQVSEFSVSHSLELTLMAVSVTGAVLAIIYASIQYNNGKNIPVADGEDRSPINALAYHKFYIDELYDLIIRKPLDVASKFFYKIIDLKIIDGFVNGLGKVSIESSRGLRLLQTGNVGFYIFVMVIGIIAMMAYSLFRI
ncbi:MAG: hypothetical protein ACRYFL_06570, partial [Janthinobacterium lividum]